MEKAILGEYGANVRSPWEGKLTRCRRKVRAAGLAPAAVLVDSGDCYVPPATAQTRRIPLAFPS